MTTNENAVYTPNPTTLDVTVLKSWETGAVSVVRGGKDFLIDRLEYEIIGHEDAPVIGRGNLCGANERWYQIQLADGSKHYAIGEGS